MSKPSGAGGGILGAPRLSLVGGVILQAGGRGTICEPLDLPALALGAAGLGLTSGRRRAIPPAGFLRLDVSNIGQIQSDQRRGSFLGGAWRSTHAI